MSVAIGQFARVAALCAAAALVDVASGQDAGESGTGEAETSVDEEVIVRGRSPAELRFQIQLAEEAVFARFNDINSDDRFDITCRSEPVLGSRLDRRSCRSNSWREQDANYAIGTLQQLRGETGPIPEQSLAEQRFMQARLEEEMRRLLREDEELYEAVMRLGEARRALAEHRGGDNPWSVSRQVIPGERGLPYDARLMFEVEIGRDRFSHRLTHQTFEIAHVDGKIRRLEVECDQGRERHKYDGEISWTLPPGWSACTLSVDAKRGATFTVYEFD